MRVGKAGGATATIEWGKSLQRWNYPRYEFPSSFGWTCTDLQIWAQLHHEVQLLNERKLQIILLK
jgi:hypothetical protein